MPNKIQSHIEFSSILFSEPNFAETSLQAEIAIKPPSYTLLQHKIGFGTKHLSTLALESMSEKRNMWVTR